MYIARRTGGGRGVYEVAGQTTTGQTPDALVGRNIVAECPDGLRFPLGVALTVQGGKHRLVLNAADMQIQRQLAALLMLPSPRRDNNNWGTSYRSPVRQAYVINRIQLSQVDLSNPGRAVVIPDILELENAAGPWFVQIQDRFEELEYVRAHSQRLPNDLQALIKEHDELVTGNGSIPARCEHIVREIQKALGSDEEMRDPLPILFGRVTGEIVEQQVQEALTFGETPLVLPKRSWAQITRRRGQSGFRDALLTAYDQRCQISEYTGIQALEAAHIVPYSVGGADINHPSNGLLLRADIHTLFDLGLVKVIPDTLTVRISQPLAESSYRRFEGTELYVTENMRPSQDALERKWTQNYELG